MLTTSMRASPAYSSAAPSRRRRSSPSPARRGSPRSSRRVPRRRCRCRCAPRRSCRRRACRARRRRCRSGRCTCRSRTPPSMSGRSCGEVAAQRPAEVRGDVRVRRVHAGVDDPDRDALARGPPLCAVTGGADHLHVPLQRLERIGSLVALPLPWPGTVPSPPCRACRGVVDGRAVVVRRPAPASGPASVAPIDSSIIAPVTLASLVTAAAKPASADDQRQTHLGLHVLHRAAGRSDGAHRLLGLGHVVRDDVLAAVVASDRRWLLDTLSARLRRRHWHDQGRCQNSNSHDPPSLPHGTPSLSSASPGRTLGRGELWRNKRSTW